MKLKIVISVILAALMLFSLAACAEVEKPVEELFFGGAEVQYFSNLGKTIGLGTTLTAKDISAFNDVGLEFKLNGIKMQGVNVEFDPAVLSVGLKQGTGAMSGDIKLESNGKSISGNLYADKDIIGFKIDDLMDKYINVSSQIPLGGSANGMDTSKDNTEEIDTSRMSQILASFDTATINKIISDVKSVLVDSMDKEWIEYGTADLEVNGGKLATRTATIKVDEKNMVDYVVDVLDGLDEISDLKRLVSGIVGCEESEVDFGDFKETLGVINDSVDFEYTAYYSGNYISGIDLLISVNSQKIVDLKLRASDKYFSLKGDLQLDNINYELDFESKLESDNFEMSCGMTGGGVSLKLEIDGKKTSKNEINFNFKVTMNSGISTTEFELPVTMVIHSYSSNKIDLEFKFDLDLEIFVVDFDVRTTLSKSSGTINKPDGYAEYTVDEIADLDIETGLLEKISEMFPAFFGESASGIFGSLSGSGSSIN